MIKDTTVDRYLQQIKQQTGVTIHHQVKYKNIQIDQENDFSLVMGFSTFWYCPATKSLSWKRSISAHRYSWLHRVLNPTWTMLSWHLPACLYNSEATFQQASYLQSPHTYLEDRGHYITNPNHTPFSWGNPSNLPYICIVFHSFFPLQMNPI